MAAFRIGHKIKIVNRGWMQRRPQKSFAGIGYWPRRQPRVAISIIRRIDAQIRKSESSFVGVLLFKRVNNGWIAIERNAFAQTIFKYAGDDGAFVGLGRFTFDERGERDDVFRTRRSLDDFVR